MSAEINAKRMEFKRACISEDVDLVVQRYLLDGTAYFFDSNGDVDEFIFKRKISESLDAHIRDIAIIGSGKLGFSIKPDRDELGLFPFKAFDENKKSDIDVAIVSGRLFDEQLVRLYKHTGSYVSSEVWNEKHHRNSLAQYVLKGWIKPDFIPKDYKISDKINEVQTYYQMKFGREINIGIYKSWFFFEAYHKNNIRNINLNLIGNG